MSFREGLHSVRSLGRPGLLAALLLLLAGAGMGATRWMDERAAASQREVARLEAQLRQALAGPAPVLASRNDWLERLPAASTRQQRLADLLEISIHEGLSITRTEHRLSTDAASGLERVRVSMPLQGSYAQIRSFVSAALQHDPALSLDTLKLRRNNPQATVIDAELVWSLHSRKVRDAS